MSSQSDSRKVHHQQRNQWKDPTPHPPSLPKHCSLGVSVLPPFAKSSSCPFVFLPEQQSLSARAGGGPGLAVVVERSRQALRALATSVKTRRLGLCVLPCEVVRVCGGHGTVNYPHTRPRAAGNSVGSVCRAAGLAKTRRRVSTSRTCAGLVANVIKTPHRWK